MEMFVRVSEYRIVPTSNIVDIDVSPAQEAGWDDGEWEPIIPRPLRVDILTTASQSRYDDGGDYPETRHVEISPYVITLRGAEAQTFLDALPIYSPAREEIGA